MMTVHRLTVTLSRSYYPSIFYLTLFLIAQDDGTDIEFRNVGFYISDAGEIPKRTQTNTLLFAIIGALNLNTNCVVNQLYGILTILNL